MERRQNPDLLSMAGLGTTGGQARADGSTLERGIHLRWQIADRLGFPSGGFDVYRREQNLTPYLCCGRLALADGGLLRWLPSTPGMTCPPAEIRPSGENILAAGCGVIPGVLLSGVQTLSFDFREPIRHASITLDASSLPTPQLKAYWSTGGGMVHVATRDGQQDSTGTWTVQVFADRIDRLVLSGENLLVCEVCLVRVMDGYDQGWGALPLNGTLPIYLPITNPEWYSPHAHAPDDQAEAEARLPTNLSADARDRYSAGFGADLHGILYDLVGTDPQNLYLLDHPDEDSAAALEWPGMNLLLLLALDPNIARILGLYWMDLPPKANKYYDYKVVAHYGQRYAPGRGIDFRGLDEGSYFGSSFSSAGLTFFSPNPLSIGKADWDGSEWNCLSVAGAVPDAPLAILLPPGNGSVWVRAVAQADLSVSAYAGPNLVMEQVVSAGERVLGFASAQDITSLVLKSAAGFSLVEIALAPSQELLFDLEYVSFHQRLEVPPPVLKPVLETPQLVAARTGLSPDGALQEQQSDASLRWGLPEAGGAYFEPGSPVFYQVQRAARGNDPRPAPLTTSEILNEDSPVLVTGAADQAGGLSRKTGYFTDRGLADGWYSYQVRGIDLFGRLGSWSLSKTLRVQDHLSPPPPVVLAARYLDPFDPWLSETDRDWAAANGPGLKLNWEWAGIQRLQAPDVLPPSAEFRVYVTSGDANSLSGKVLSVTEEGEFSSLATDLAWHGALDALAGEVLRVNGNFFPVVGNSQGAGCLIRVTNLASPPLSPRPGPCSLAFTPGRGYWKDFSQKTNWDLRLHAEPALEIPLVSGQVRKVVDYASDGREGFDRPGAARTVVTDQALLDAQGVLRPGVLLCAGTVYPAYGHTLGNALKIHILPQPAAAQSLSLVEPPPGASFVYYPGRTYEVRLNFDIPLPLGGAPASFQVALTCSDGKPYVVDQPIWSKEERGGLGGRPGNESTLSRLLNARPMRYNGPPLTVNAPRAGQPIFAGPANFYGQAHYTLGWEAVPGVSAYAVYRSSGAALFDHDRQQRAARQGAYAPPLAEAAVFGDDPGFAAWLAAFDPALTLHALLSSPEDHLDAWRSWAARFYPTLADAQVQALADLAGNEKAFQRVTKDPLSGLSYLDSFDGRGQGFYIYKVRSIDAAGSLSAYSSAFPPVHIYDITPPATPTVTSVKGAENSVLLSWRANGEKDLQEYRVWRSANPADLGDIRRTAPLAALPPTPGVLEEDWTDGGLTGGQTLYYRLAAVDSQGNVSPPTRVLSARAYDMTEPVPPAWERAEWVRIGPNGSEVAYDSPGAEGYPPAVALQWLAAEPGGVSILERRVPTSLSWMPLTDWIAPEDLSDPLAEAARRYTYTDLQVDSLRVYEYRVRFQDGAGNTNRNFALAEVGPPLPA